MKGQKSNRLWSKAARGLGFYLTLFSGLFWEISSLPRTMITKLPRREGKGRNFAWLWWSLSLFLFNTWPLWTSLIQHSPYLFCLLFACRNKSNSRGSSLWGFQSSPQPTREPFQSSLLWIQWVFGEFLLQASTILGSGKDVGVLTRTNMCAVHSCLQHVFSHCNWANAKGEGKWPLDLKCLQTSKRGWISEEKPPKNGRSPHLIQG